MARIILLIALVASGTAQAAEPPTVTPLGKVGTEEGIDLFPSMACDASGRLYVLWRHEEKRELMLASTTSTDGGATFSPPARISLEKDKPFLDSSNPVSVAGGEDGVAVAAWTDLFEGPRNPDVYTSHTTDGGATWSAPERPRTDPAGIYQGNPDLCRLPDGTWLLTYVERRRTPPLNGGFLVTSTDNGESWTGGVDPVAAPVSESSAVRIAVDPKGKIFLVWRTVEELERPLEACKLEFKRDQWVTSKARNAGRDFIESDVCPKSPPDVVSLDDRGNLGMVARAGNRERAIHYYLSQNRAASFRNTCTLAEGDEDTELDHPRIALDGKGRVVVAWYGDGSVHLVRSEDNGLSFSKPVTLPGASPFLMTTTDGTVLLARSVGDSYSARIVIARVE